MPLIFIIGLCNFPVCDQVLLLLHKKYTMSKRNVEGKSVFWVFLRIVKLQHKAPPPSTVGILIWCILHHILILLI
jgi:hypothetical protein